MIYVKPEGPRNAAIMLVGEGPGADEEHYGRPFCGAAGYELSSELRDAGIARSDCFVTNVVRYRPEKNDISLFITGVKRDGESRGFKFHNGMWVAPFVIEHIQHLENEINEVRPNVIVALGNTALWALTGHLGVTKWRGSQMKSKFGPKVVPILHPALILREYSWRAITVQDYKNRVVPESRTPDYDPPKYDFTIRPSFGQVACILGVILSELGAKKNYRVAVDIETRKGQIACLGLATSTRRALCIPFVCLENPSGYWTTDEELWIITKLREIMTHPNVWLVGQNFLYDSQYIINQWKFIPRCTQDTMLWHHTLFPGLQKGLDFLASLYAEFYCYWKDEGKEWHLKVDEEVLWNYNCLDCVYTYEVSERLEESAEKLNLRKQVAFQQSQFLPVLGMMLQGIKVDTARRKEYHTQLENSIKAEQSSIDYIVGHPLNTRSGPQMQRLFYTDLKQKQIISRKTGSVTLDSKALDTLSVREPLLRPLIDKIQNIRSMGVFKSTFIEAELDPDNRARCSFNIAGTETFRFSSSTNAFGRGLNLQNIPRVGSDPDVRKMFVPDDDCFIMDWDLDRADLQVVVWEAGDEGLKQALRENVDLHTENAKVLLCQRNVAKTWVHGTNYGGSARTMASNCGITVHQSDTMRKRWFAAHPGIFEWHRRVEQSLASYRSVWNAFGYRRMYFDRIEGILPEALAWIPQSTVAIVINTGLVRVFHELPEVQLLLQVHDSLVMQSHRNNIPSVFPKIRKCLEVTVPYPDPLIIPVSAKGSYVSWGDCEKLKEAA